MGKPHTSYFVRCDGPRCENLIELMPSRAKAEMHYCCAECHRKGAVALNAARQSVIDPRKRRRASG